MADTLRRVRYGTTVMSPTGVIHDREPARYRRRNHTACGRTITAGWGRTRYGATCRRCLDHPV